MRDFVQGQGMREFQPQKYIKVFRGLKFEHDAACPAIALATAEDWAKWPFMDRH
jgi:hypothetical protein